MVSVPYHVWPNGISFLIAMTSFETMNFESQGKQKLGVLHMGRFLKFWNLCSSRDEADKVAIDKFSKVESGTSDAGDAIDGHHCQERQCWKKVFGKAMEDNH
eukprot:gnl/MRDRNA2_/MRDRNA2_65758_c0_seq2.p1 gnl/MRDRNA2_/MRDRNA2_65758_c0~~gnl/MRDRNA2_/MRDRNA2_65758_c0_seq2.p1  ORF type:complete len:102 (+),score=14.82 gnl/MRDRNA2_/MRDRNA2_65758_c0_seq2:80-385(+)